MRIFDSVRYLTCSNCGTQLSIVKNDGAVFAERVELSGSPESVKLQNDIVQLDYAWELERQKYLVRFKRGFHEPSALYYIAFTTFTLLGFGFIVGSKNPQSGAFDLLLAILFTSLFAVKLGDCIQKGATLKARRAAYKSRRNELQRQLSLGQ